MQLIAEAVYNAVLIPVANKNKGRKKNCRPLFFLQAFYFSFLVSYGGFLHAFIYMTALHP